MASQKKNLFYVERGRSAIRAARLSVNGSGSVIEEVQSISSSAPEEVKAFVQRFGRLKAGQLMRAACAVYPEDRLFRHCSLKEAARPGDPKTLEEIVAKQFKVNPAEYSLMALNADDGTPFDASRVNREVVICGARKASILEAQDYLVECGIYPVRLELASVATAGMYLRHAKAEGMEEPFLLLEIDEASAAVVILNKGRVDSTRALSLGLNSMIAGVREELGLKDEGAARRLFFSDSFDFREMGPRLVERILRELQSLIGFYEVQTGQSIGRVCCTFLPPKLGWLNETFANSLGMKTHRVDFPALLAKANFTTATGVPPVGEELSQGLLGVMLNQ